VTDIRETEPRLKQRATCAEAEYLNT